MNYNHRVEFEHQKLSWSDLIRAELEGAGASIFAWEVVAEGAIVSVSEGPGCAGLWVYMVGGPESIKIPLQVWTDFKSATFPQLKAYHNCPSKDEYEKLPQELDFWIKTGRDFVEAVRNLPREYLY